jgi:hypothetical protein
VKRATFLLSKDPSVDHGGDIALSRLMMRLAAESVTVDAICLSRESEPSPDPALIRVRKPAVSLPRIAARSLVKRRSVVHTRFTVPEFTAALNRLDPDMFLVEHNYMVESFLDSRHAGSTRMLLNTVNSESLVWVATRGIVGRLEHSRIIADEVRTARAAHAVGTYDQDEAAFYRRNGVARARWLDVTLPPARRATVESSGPRLVFLGDRTWPPNQEAFELLVRWWPSIAHGIPGAELLVIGKPDPASTVRSLPPGMRDIGFAPDLDEVLDGARALLAPISTGGGVRVKMLDAASRGLPIVPTTAALGSLGPVFGIDVVDGEEAFVARAREYLLDREAASREAHRLYEANASRWEQRIPHARVQDWIES